MSPEKSVAETSDGALKIFEQKWSDEDLKARRASHAALTATDFVLDGKHPVKMKTIKGSEELEKVVFIEPSLVIFNSPGLSLEIKDAQDGRPTLSFTGVFFDGHSEEVPGPRPQEKIPVPESAKIKDHQSLLNSLLAAQKTPRFLSGCIKKVKLSVAGTSYPVAWEPVRSEDGAENLCDLENRVIRFQAAVAPSVLSSLGSDGADLRLNITYQMTAPLVLKGRKIVLDGKMLFRQLSKRFSSSSVLGAAHLEAASEILRYLQDWPHAETLQKALGTDYEKAKALIAEEILSSFFSKEGRSAYGLRAFKEEKEIPERLVITLNEVETMAIGTTEVMTFMMRSVTRSQASFQGLLKGAEASIDLSIEPNSLVAIEVSSVEVERRLRLASEIKMGVPSPYDIMTTRKIPCGPTCSTRGMDLLLVEWEHRLWRSENLDPSQVPYEASTASLPALARDFFAGLIVTLSGSTGARSQPLTLLPSAIGDRRAILFGASADVGTAMPLRLNVANQIQAEPVSIRKEVLLQSANSPIIDGRRDEGTLTYSPYLRVSGFVLLRGLEVSR